MGLLQAGSHCGFHRLLPEVLFHVDFLTFEEPSAFWKQLSPYIEQNLKEGGGKKQKEKRKKQKRKQIKRKKRKKKKGTKKKKGKRKKEKEKKKRKEINLLEASKKLIKSLQRTGWDWGLKQMTLSYDPMRAQEDKSCKKYKISASCPQCIKRFL